VETGLTDYKFQERVNAMMYLEGVICRKVTYKVTGNLITSYSKK